MTKTFFMVDIKSDGPVPEEYSMLFLGAVVVDETLDKTFKVDILPVSDKYEKDN